MALIDFQPVPARVDTARGCAGCHQPVEAFEFAMAFQPMVDLARREVFAWEALVRGVQGESAASVLGRVTAENRYWFDQRCRVQAIESATRLGMKERLSINFLPNAVYEPAACIRATPEAADRCGFDIRRILFEVTENEEARDRAHLHRIFTEYRRRGFMTALDDFGEGYSTLSLLAAFQPDLVKLDMSLVRGIENDAARRVIVGAMVGMLRDLGTRVLAEGVETEAEARVLHELGITLMQGWLFARPALEALPAPRWPAFLD